MAKTQEIIGGYALEAELGRGGMGLVYQARHPEHGVVALKRLQPFPKAFASQSLRSEIRMLSMLNHPGVVKLIDHGMEERGPWMAMEYIRGRSLSDHLSEGPASVPISGRASTNHVIRLPGTLDAGDTLASTMTTIPQPFTAFSGIVFEEDPKSPRTPATEEVAQQRLRWLHQVCQALSYIHGQGIVHADLKPGNILITSTGRVVLVDFGLATQFGSRVQVEALLRAGLLAGSLAYISPEQCRGEPLDARADLYAVGCILCELLTGSPPFGHQRSDLSLMNHHIHTPPPSLGQLVSPQPETWSPLETLMDELLAKQPEQRPGFAQVVLRAVENVGVGISGDRTLEGRPYLHKAPLVGRQQLFGCLVEAFREALRGRGKWVLLRGESGVGKTRLMQELVRVARRLDAVVWVGYSSGEGLGSPLGLFVPILRAIADRCVQMGPEYTAGVFRSYAMAVLAPYAPFLRALPGIEGVASGTLARLPVESARLRLFTCLVEVLRRSSEEYASLIVLDDLQWADVLSLDALKFMGQELGRLPWLVVGTTRVEEWSGSALEQMSEGCSSEVLEVFEVERLHRESAVQMIGQMLGHPPDPDLSNALLVRAGTNPFFIAEYLRAAVVSGLLQLDRGGRWRVAEAAKTRRHLDIHLGRLPSSIHGLLAERLKQLDAPMWALCQAAAVLGKRVELNVLRATAKLEEHLFRDALDGLLQRSILEVSRVYDAELQFAHDTLREVAYAQTNPEVLVGLHRKTAEVLEKTQPLDLSVVALHWVRGGEVARGRARYIEAAQRDAERWAIQDARRHLVAALEAAPNPTGDVELRMELMRLDGLVGDHPSVVSGAKSLLDLLDTKEDPKLLGAQICLEAADSLMQLGRLDEANHITQAAAQRIGQRQDPHLQGLLAFTLGKLALESHDTHPQGGELFKRAAELHAEAGEPALEARSLMELALFTGLALGRPDEAMARYMKALDLVRQVDDLHGEAQLWLHVGKLHINQGRHTNSLECYARALELHRKTGNTHEEATVLMRIGALKNELGYYREGLACMMEALAFKERYDAKRWRLLSTIATTHVSLGELREAIAWMERAQQQAEREGVTDSIVLLAQHGHLAMCRGDCATLRSVVDQLTPLAEASSPDSAARIVLLQYASRLALMESTFIQAEELFRQCADMCKEQGRMLFLTYAHTGLSTALCRQGRFDEAEAVLSQSSTPVTQASYAALDTAMTILRLHQSRYQEAANHADKSRIIMERSGNLLNLICVLCWRCLAAHGLDETMEPWLALIRRHTEGLELYSTSEVGQALLAVQAVDPNALPFTFLDDAPQAQV